MKLHHEKLSDVDRYIANHKHLKLEDLKPEFDAILSYIKRFKNVDHATKILEIGTGIGWFPLICKMNGFQCKGMEISPQLVEYAKILGLQYGIDPDIELANIEEEEMGTSIYDVIIATSTFEHVEYWQKGIEKIFRALRPGGLFYFYSTNKFSLRSGEYRFPLYSWLPDSWRYSLRIKRQGEDIMKLGIDFNQFTYPQLRSFFHEVGFSKIFDRIEIMDPDNLNNPRAWKRYVLKILKNAKLCKHLVLFFSSGTFFICIK